MNLPQGIQPDEISMLTDEYTVFQLDTTLERAERIEEYWQIAFDIKKCDGTPEYPIPNKVVKALLSIPHGNADLAKIAGFCRTGLGCH